METSLPPAQPRNMDLSLPTCRETRCSSHGSCVLPPGGSTRIVCNCDLGYQGEFCDHTVHGTLGLLLTITMLVVIIGLFILAFVLAKLRQKQKKKRRNLSEKDGCNSVN